MKKVISIILVIALVLSFAGCDSKTPSETSTPTVAPATVAPTSAPETEAPTVEPTVAPTEAPETEEPQKEGWISLAKPMGTVGSVIPTLEFENNALAVPAGDESYKVDISDIEAGRTVTITGDEFTGDITIEGDVSCSIEINLPNAHVVFNGKVGELNATTSATTLVVGKDAEIQMLNINGGNAEISGTVGSISISAENKTTTSVIIATEKTEAQKPVQVRGGNKVVVETKGNSNPIIVNGVDGTIVIASGASNPIVSVNGKDIYVQNNSTEKVAVQTNAGAVELEPGKEIVNANESLEDADIPTDKVVTLNTALSENLTISYGQTYIFGAGFSAGSYEITNHGVIKVSDEVGLRAALTAGGEIVMTANIDVVYDSTDENDHDSSLQITRDTVLDGGGFNLTREKDNSDLKNLYQTVISVMNYELDVTIKNVNFKYDTYAEQTYLLALLEGSNVTVDNCEFKSAKSAIQFFGNDLVVKDCKFDEIETCMMVQDRANVDNNITIIGNEITNSTYGFYTWNATNDVEQVVIDGNTFDNCTLFIGQNTSSAFEVKNNSFVVGDRADNGNYRQGILRAPRGEGFEVDETNTIHTDGTYKCYLENVTSTATVVGGGAVEDLPVLS